MATSEQIKALIRSHLEKDESRFYSIALQVAAHAAKQGHSKLADELRTIIDDAKERGYEFNRIQNVTSINQPRGELAGLLSVYSPEEQLSNLILPAQNLERLNKVVLEHRQREKLAEFGLSPRRKVLLYGPPGTGKTLTASALAGELKLPLYTILIDGLITKYMGETAAKLRLIFDHISKVKGVYFFDEFDAIGAHRNSQNDVGEIRRVLNSFLQFLEQSNSDSIILAATNNLGLLDKALFRRFDDVIEYRLPNKSLALKTLKHRLSFIKSKQIDFETLAEYCEKQELSFAEICKASEDSMKEIILSEDNKILTTDVVLECLRTRKSSSNG